jgi:hypothetical protein
VKSEQEDILDEQERLLFTTELAVSMREVRSKMFRRLDVGIEGWNWELELDLVNTAV